MTELLGAQELINGDLAKLLARLVLDLAFASVVIRFVYFRIYRNQEYLFTYYLFNIITFSLCLLLRKVPIELGFALGLFAVFGILRYRTEAIRIRDLTYLFIVIGLGILNALASESISVAELLTVNVVIVGATALLERRSSATEEWTPVLYDRLQLLRPENEAELVADLMERTGLPVVRAEVQRFDMLRDCAELAVYYAEPGK